MNVSSIIEAAKKLILELKIFKAVVRLASVSMVYVIIANVEAIQRRDAE